MFRAVLPLILTLAAATAAYGDDPLAAATARPVRAARAATAIVVDGALTDPAWQQAEAVDWFLQRDPNEGTTPSQRTDVRILFDDDALYIGARMYDTAPDSILPRLTRRDVSIPCDRFGMYIDPFYDRRSGYYFLVNCAGTKYDGTLYNDGWEDSSWDGVWEGRARIDAEGWTCEMRIPYSQMRFQKANDYQWGINFRRVIQRHNEEDMLVYQPKKGSGFVSRFPTLTGIQSVTPGRSIEVIPYLTSQAEYLRHAPSDPFNDGSDYTPDGGVDVRMPLGSRLTLNATVNPDFGQVEVDPAVVNLSDIESFFQEKRSFFVEGATVFNTGNQGANDYWGFNWPEPTFFYSRRIGRAPQGGVSDNDFADVPRGVSILGAGKITGKISPTVNFGMVHAVTAKESADLDAGGARFREEVEPLTYYGVMRALKEFKDRKHGLGFMTTYTKRAFDDDRLRDEMNDASILTAIDGWHFLDKDQMWVVSGWAGGTHVTGTKARLLALQQDPRHYFQRPDAGHVEVDPDATSMTGYGARMWLNKQKGSSFGNAAVGFMNPKFENNDLGFLSRTDVINAHAGYGYKWTETTKARKYQNVLGAVFGSWDFDGNTTWGGVWGGGTTEFINNYSWEYRFAFNPQTVNNRRTRGGPLTLNEPGYEVFNYFDTDGKAKLFYYLETYAYTQPDADSYNWYVFPGMEWKPVSSLTLNVGPGFERVRSTSQYIDTIDDATATATFGRRYIFGELDQKTLSANIRLNWAFSPTLSLQFYGQPLISSGKYTAVRELARARSYDFAGPGAGTWTYDPVSGLYDRDTATSGDEENPDFNFKSLRGNAVLRWEYLPGSTFYLVWTQERTDDEDLGTFNVGKSFRRLVKADADNIFLAKVSYYWNL